MTALAGPPTCPARLPSYLRGDQPDTPLVRHVGRGPLQQDRQPASEPHQKHDVHENPQQPAGEPGHPGPPEICYGVRTTYRGHVPGVAIAEGRRGPLTDSADDIARRVDESR
jgi:hypothetical protein